MEFAKLARVSQLNDSAFEFALARASEIMEAGDFDRAAGLLGVAVKIIAHQAQGSGFASRRLESLLSQLSRDGVPVNHVSRTWVQPIRRVLHVTTETYPMWGHTALIRNWLALDRGRTYSVALTHQRQEVPASLAEAVKKSGGKIHRLEPAMPVLAKAVELRRIAGDYADCVVLQSFAADLSAALAFGSPGGPPVVTYDSIDHLFWPGGSVSDAIFTMRESGREVTTRFRGTARVRLLPVPLAASERIAPEEKRAAREQLELPAGARVVLMLSAGYKVDGKGNPDFLDAALQLAACRDVYVLAVGPTEDQRWLRAAQCTQRRIRAYGPQPHERVRTFLAAANVYAEGFPTGSLTALLEPAMAGIACVRCPATTPLPYASDSPAIDFLPRPATVAAYVQRILALLDDEATASKLGQELSGRVRFHHTGPAWVSALEAAYANLPADHQVYPLGDVETPPPDVGSYWLGFTHGGATVAASQNAWRQLMHALAHELNMPADCLTQTWREALKCLAGTPLETALHTIARDSIDAAWLGSLRTTRSRTLLSASITLLLKSRPRIVLRREFWSALVQCLTGQPGVEAFRFAARIAGSNSG